MYPSPRTGRSSSPAARQGPGASPRRRPGQVRCQHQHRHRGGHGAPLDRAPETRQPGAGRPRQNRGRREEVDRHAHLHQRAGGHRRAPYCQRAKAGAAQAEGPPHQPGQCRKGGDPNHPQRIEDRRPSRSQSPAEARLQFLNRGHHAASRRPSSHQPDFEPQGSPQTGADEHGE
jgi:hypothetical protein